MILSGALPYSTNRLHHSLLIWGSSSRCRLRLYNNLFSTLATDRGFKERVREDMLVRLLDAFVWRNQGDYYRLLPYSHHSPPCRQTRVVSAARLHIRAGHECSGSPISLYHAFGTGSFLLLREIHRRVLSALRTTYPRGCPSWSESSFLLNRDSLQFINVHASISFLIDV
jgi:hypothetical protein